MQVKKAFQELRLKIGPTVKAALTGAGLLFDCRLQTGKGADVASAGTITLGNDANVFGITGNTLTNYMTTTNWQDGSIVTLIFAAAPTLAHNAGSVPANTAPFQLAGAANFVASAGDTLTLVKDGSNWREIARAVI